MCIPYTKHKMPTYKYPRPSVTVDVVVFGVDHDDDDTSLKVLLVRRKHPPFKDKLALPGGFVHMKETLEDAAYRELKEETSIEPASLEQLYTFGQPNRDPRGRVISSAYMALVRQTDHHAVAGSDADAICWRTAWNMYPWFDSLAFDHSEILKVALERLTAKVRYAPLGFDLLPKFFSISDLHRLYEAILNHPIDKRNFYKKILSLGMLTPDGKEKTKERGKPARLYSFNSERYKELTKQGFNFDL